MKTVSGVVTDPKSKPIANATVCFAREPDKKDFTGEWSERLRVQMLGFHHAGKAVTDKDGKWEITAFPDQPGLEVKCTVSHPDHAVKVLILDHAALERDGYFSGEAKLMLAEPFRVRGKVVNPDGSPAAEAAIFWCSMFDPASAATVLKSIETKSNAAGEFELRARVPENTKIVVLPKSGAAPLLHGLQASPEMDPVTLQLGIGRILKGKVVNRHTRPFADLPILFSGWMESRVPFPVHPIVAVTDADGNWTWEGAPKGNVTGRVALPSGAFQNWGEQRGDQSIVVSAEE